MGIFDGPSRPQTQRAAILVDLEELTSEMLTEVNESHENVRILIYKQLLMHQ